MGYIVKINHILIRLNEKYRSKNPIAYFAFRSHLRGHLNTGSLWKVGLPSKVISLNVLRLDDCRKSIHFFE